MDNPPDQTDQPPISNVVDLQSPDPKLVRRKFVQTTLFPLKPHDTKVEEIAADDGDAAEVGGSQGGKRKRGRPKGSTTPQKRGSKKVNDTKVEVIADDDDEEEVCGSQGGKRKRARNTKGNSTPSKRVSKKAAVNGKDASVVDLDDTESPDDASPHQLKTKQRASTRNGRTNGNKATSTSKLSTHPIATLQSPQPVPDLWLEAKKTAEENSRIFAGKQIHPFFSSWKAGKKDLETIEAENNGYFNKRKERNVEIGPIHVFDNVKDDLDSIDWSNWTFDEGIFSTSCNQERKRSCFEGIVGSLNFDDIPRASNTSRTSLLLKDVSLAHFCSTDEDFSVMFTYTSPIVINEDVTPCDSLKNLEKNSEETELCIFGKVGQVSTHFEQQNVVPQERNMEDYLNRGNYPENSMWANKYHPEKGLEVCGNSEAVKFINDWLHRWHEMDFRFSKSSYSADKCLIQDGEYDSDSDAENLEASGLKNVLLVTGPVGSGKSAAIYACAKEQGFQVIEVNASDWRNGALLKQKFGEAVGSHFLKRAQESPKGKLNLKTSPVKTNGAAEQYLNDGLVEVISLSEEEDYVGNNESQYHGNGKLSCDKGDIKSLILFEDVDITLCDDRGFISTIQQLADIGKRPMILTNECPLLPDSLDREEVCFTMPSLKELADHIFLVSSAEKANIQPNLIERCIKFCGGDIRKTLMNLQFWCQSKECVKDGNMRSIFSPLMFNLEAGHRVLPKLIPWALPSSLSEFVEAEVAKSFCKMEENHSLLGLIEEEESGDISIQDQLDLDISESASIEAKKEAILSGDCFLHVDNDIIEGSNTCEFFNSSGSPVAFTRRNVRRKSDTVLSESEDEICNNEYLAVSDSLPGDGNDTLSQNSQFSVLHLALEGLSNSVGGQLLQSGAKEVELARHRSPDMEHANDFNFFAVGNSCKQSTDLLVHSAEEKHQHLEFVRANCSSNGDNKDSLSLLNDLLAHTQDGNLDTNMHQFPVVDYEMFSIIGNSNNQSAHQVFHFGDANGVKIETENAGNLCLDPLSDQVRTCKEGENPIKRCLFTPPTHADPISGTIGSTRNQSTGQLMQCIEKASMAEPQHWHLEMGTVNLDGPVIADVSFNPSFDHLNLEKTQNSENQHPETASANPFSYTALGDSFNPSNDQLFHFVEAKEKEIQRQHPETVDRSDNSFVAVDVPLLQLSNQFCEIGKEKEIQQQHPQVPTVKHASCLQVGDSLKLMSEQIYRDEAKAKSAQHLLPDKKNVFGFASFPAVDNSPNPLDGQTLNLAKAEEHHRQYSDATNFNHFKDQCQSFDMSYVPESTFVPETEVNDGTECPSGTDMMEIVSPIATDDADPSVIGHQASDYRFCGIDLNLNARDEEMGDSHRENEHHEPSTSGCQVMDECSRMDFFKKSKKSRSSALKVKNPVQERWNELRQTDLGQYCVTEHKNALQLVELGYRMSNLISEGDLLLHDYEFLLNDSSGLSEEDFSFGLHDQQIQMAFYIAQYGYFLYAKEIDALQSKLGLANNLHLGWEMLISTTNSMALGKLLSLNKRQIPLIDTSIKQAATTVDISSTREREMCLQNIVQSVVPLRSYLTVRGSVLHDYLSSLTHISRSEASRSAEAAEKTKRRRVRVAKNYLSCGGLDLSQDDILKLNEYDFCRRDSSKSTPETYR
uniref:AAA+ ATPase domain-containing protein n=1 Tax=Chenopodium quinoa TaxID=63459 RepID=A0A803LV03_CHEQI